MRKALDWMIGHYRQFCFDHDLPLRYSVLSVFISRTERLDPYCLIDGVCPECGCKLPEMLWVKECLACDLEELNKQKTQVDETAGLNFIELGEYKQGEQVPIVYVDNSGKTIEKVSASCGCTNIKLKENQVTGKINTAGQAGRQVKTIKIIYEGDSQEKLIRFSYLVEANSA